MKLQRIVTIVEYGLTGLCEIGKPSNFIYGNTIEDFFKFFENEKSNYTLYFHNAKFDIEFIFNYLLENGFEVIKDKRDKKDKSFTTLISDMGQFYSCEIYFKVTKNKTKKLTIYDSLKILNFSVEQIAKDFNLPISKLKIDYKAKREKGHELTPEEVDYLRNDVEIMARALKIMFDNDLKKMTIGSDALHSYKKMTKNFDKYFPILEYDMDFQIRKSYKGGFTYLNPIYKGKETGSGIVFDKNSMYPAKMKFERLPYGEPILYEGKYKEDKLYNLYIQVISTIFDLKPGKIPTIQIKNNLSFEPNEYLESSNGDLVTLSLTNIDLELFLENYNITYIKYHGGYKFKSVRGLFSDYIDHWTEEKIKAKKEKNGAMYRIAKLMLNSLYGKFGLNPNVRGKYPTLTENGIVYKFYPEEKRDSIFVPIASFITSYARADIIRSSQLIREYSLKKYGVDCYVYSPTRIAYIVY